MAGNLTAMIASIFSGGVTPDPYYEYTTLLLPGNGTNGAQNNTFLDGSTNNFTITRNGNTTQGTFSPFSQTGWGGAFNTSTTYLTVTDTANLRFGSSNFTIEAWVYRNASGATQTIASKGASTPTGWVFQISSADKLVFTDTSTSITGATSIAANTWTYVAVVRAGTGTNQTTLYVNGTSDGTGTSATNFNQTSNMLVGADRSTTNFANGYISNLRLSNTNRTISSTPTTALTADANTIFLSLNLNRFQYTDSTAAYTNISTTGTPSVVAFSPFNPTASWSAATYGGSGYFDGSGDYLSVADNANLRFGTNAFTIQAWVYRNASGAAHSIIAKGGASTGYVLQVTSTNVLRFTHGTTNVDTTTTIPASAWTHVAAVRTNTSTNGFQLYINGVSSATATVATDFNQTDTLYIGSDRSAANVMNGYISGLKYTNGTAESISVPTGPPTATTNVALLTNFTNAGIYDATSKNDFETVGNAQISTTQSKWGGSSMYFGGTGNYLYKPYDQFLNQLNGNFTIECWIYPTTSGVQQIFAGSAVSSGSTNWLFEITSANKVSFSWVNAGTTPVSFDATSTASISTNTWTYVAAVKNGGTITVYINGSADGTSSPTGTYRNLSGGIAIGRTGDYNGIYFTGYIQDFRMSYYARTITASPTAAFPTL
jgi:hypothetical protein